MTEEIKILLDILNKVKDYDDKRYFISCGENDYLLTNDEIKCLLNYITNLQKENEDLKDNQVRALNKIKDYINASKCEILEGNYSNDEHSQYWILFNKQLKEIQKLIKSVNINQYVNIPKYREKELLNKEEKLRDYKQRNEKAIKLLKKAGCYDEETKSFCDDIWDELEILLNILEGGDE